MFNIPTFEVWVSKGKKFKGNLGEYVLEIAPYSWSENSVMFGFAAATSQTPLNMRTKTVYHSYFSCSYEDIDSLRVWYEKQATQFNSYWEKYITENFLFV